MSTSRAVRHILCIALGLTPTLACDAPAPDSAEAPAIITAPIEVSGQQFSLQGNVRVSTCDGLGGTTPRAVSAANMIARGSSALTCAGLSGTALTDCVALVDPLSVTVAFNAGTGIPGDESYSMAPQQFIVDGATNLPISYTLMNSAGSIRGPYFQFQGQSRYVYFERPVSDWVITAPTADGGTVDRDVLSENMASYRLRLEYTPTFRDGLGVLDPNDKIIGLIVNVYLNDTPLTRRVFHQFLYNCPGGLCPTDASPIDPDSAAGVSRFRQSPAVDGVSPQIIVAELPITPNTTAPHAGFPYTVTVTAYFHGGIRRDVTPAFAQADVAPCAEVDQTVVVTRPPTRIDGSIVLRRDPAHLADSPFVSAYAPTIKNPSSGLYYIVNSSGNPTYSTVADPETPFTFHWLGLPAGNYRVESPIKSSIYSGWWHGHAQLTYPGRAQLTYAGDLYRPMFRFPMRGSSTPNGVFALTEADADLDGEADAPVALDIAGDMAYLEGSLELASCFDATDLAAGIADITGATARGDDVYSRGFSRGAFLQGTSNYLIAAIEGDWVERRYFLSLDIPSQKMWLLIEPADARAYTLTTGWDNTATAPARIYAASGLSLTMAAKDASGVNIPSRNPVLEINSEVDTGLGVFRDRNTNTLLGKYYARAERIDGISQDVHTLTIAGLDSSVPVLVRPSVEVLTPDGWSRTSFPAFEYDVGANGCGACIDSTVEPPVVYKDDGNPPSIDAAPAIGLAFGTTSTTITITATDVLQVSVTANGVPMTPGPGLNEYTATVPITPATTAIEIVALDQCRRTATRTITVSIADDVCAPPVFDQCMESATGSVFYVDLVNAANEACRLPCTIAGPDLALTCEPSAIVCTP